MEYFYSITTTNHLNMINTSYHFYSFFLPLVPGLYFKSTRFLYLQALHRANPQGLNFAAPLKSWRYTHPHLSMYICSSLHFSQPLPNS